MTSNGTAASKASRPEKNLMPTTTSTRARPAAHGLDPALLERAGHHLATHGHLDRASESTRRWVDAQIRALRTDSTTPAAARALKKVGITAKTPTTVERHHARAWDTFLDELDWWVSRHGDANVPQHATSRTVDGQPYRLGLQVKNRRAEHRRGALAPDRAAALDVRAGWTWSARTDAREDAWTAHLDQLTTHVTQHGHLRGIPQTLRRWILEQRDADLPEDRATQLTELAGEELLGGPVTQFLAAAHAWLATQPPGTNMNHVTWSTTVDLAGQTIPLGRRASYYRERYRGNQGTKRMDRATIRAIAALPGWRWEVRRRPSR